MAKALAKRPKERYGTCAEFVEAAREALGLGGGPRDRKLLLLAGVGAVVAAGALATGLVLALGNGGQVQMPLSKTFFSPRFGMVADRFGVGWMVIVGP